MVWDVSSTPARLSKSIPHAHGDWVTGCVWTADCVVGFTLDSPLTDFKQALFFLGGVQTMNDTQPGIVLELSSFMLRLFQVSASNDGSLRLWDLTTGHSVQELVWTAPLSCVCCQVGAFLFFKASGCLWRPLGTDLVSAPTTLPPRDRM